LPTRIVVKKTKHPCRRILNIRRKRGLKKKRGNRLQERGKKRKEPRNYDEKSLDFPTLSAEKVLTYDKDRHQRKTRIEEPGTPGRVVVERNDSR